MYAALLDANVLFPNLLRDTVLTLAQRGLYRPLWSEKILDEARRNILAKRPDVDPVKLQRTFALVREKFDDANVEGFDPLQAGLELPDPDDRHVLAAAIHGGAQSIVTFNLKDFPAKTLADSTSRRCTPMPSSSISSTWHPQSSSMLCARW